MKTSGSQPQTSPLSWRRLFLAVAAIGALSLAGCVGTYGEAYYAPNYSGYYGDYGYGGEPYFGYDGGYYGGFEISHRHYHRSYGSHHFTGSYHGEQNAGHASFGARGGGASAPQSGGARSGQGGGGHGGGGHDGH